MPRTQTGIVPKRNTPNLPEIRIINPGKGLNTLVADQLIQDAEASDLNNIQFIESGCPSKSYGNVAVGTGLGNAPKGLGVFYTAAGSRYLLTVDGTQLKYLNGSTWTAISGASFNAGNEVNFVQAGDNLFIWDGNQGGCMLDASLTLTRLNTAVSAQFGIFYSDYQIVSGCSSKPNRIFICDNTSANLGDFTNASGELSSSSGAPGTSAPYAGTGAQYIDVNPGDGDVITGFTKFQDVLVIFKERSIYQLTFNSSGEPVIGRISSSTGCSSHKSIDNVENDVFYMNGIQGVYVLGNEPNYYTVIRSNELSARINPIIKTMTPSNLGRVASIFHDFKYYSSIPSGGTTTNNLTITYDRRYLGWSKIDYIHANSWVEYVDTEGATHLYYASDDEAEVYEIEDGTYSTDGGAIESYWISKAFDGGEFDTDKRWLDLTVWFKRLQGTITITVFTDDGTIAKTGSISSNQSASGSLGTAMIASQILGGTGEESSGDTTNNVPKRIKVNTKSRSLKIKVESNGLNESFTLLGFVMTYIPLGHYAFDSTNKIY